VLTFVLNALDLNFDGAVLTDEARRTHAKVVIDFGQASSAILAWIKRFTQVNRLITCLASVASVAVGTLVVSIAEWNTQAIVVARVVGKLADIEQQFTLVATVALLAVASVAGWGVNTTMSVFKNTLSRQIGAVVDG
jgi:hypothetical protein